MDEDHHPDGLASGCDGPELRKQLEDAKQREAALAAELASVKSELERFHKKEAEEAERQSRWASVTGNYRCSGGFLTGITIRDGYARFKMPGLEGALLSGTSYKAELRGDSLYVTDPARGAAAFRVEDGGAALRPELTLYGKRCTKTGVQKANVVANDEAPR